MDNRRLVACLLRMEDLKKDEDRDRSIVFRQAPGVIRTHSSCMTRVWLGLVWFSKLDDQRRH